MPLSRPALDSELVESNDPEKGRETHRARSIRGRLAGITTKHSSDEWMDLKLLVTVFWTIFVAELGDKTQLATLLYAADTHNPKLTVFVGAAAALIVASAIGVLAGTFISHHVSPKLLSWVAGAGFIAIGVWTIARA